MTDLDPETLRTMARELDKVADRTARTVDEACLSGFAASLAATYRTRALRVEIGWNAPTRELPIVTPRPRAWSWATEGEVGDGSAGSC